MNLPADNTAFDPKRALIVGASGRMVAALLSQLGIKCSVADLYGDSDTFELCDGRVQKLNKLSDLLSYESFVRSNDLVVFAGGLEGSLGLLKTLSRWIRPAFADADSVRRMIDVDAFNGALSKIGVVDYPLISDPRLAKYPAVAKDVAHSATANLVHSTDEFSSHESKNRVLQNFIDGESVSQIFVTGDGTVECLGETIQLTKSLSWFGSISGLELSPGDQEKTVAFATAIAIQAKFTGAFGIDFIRNQDGIFPVDVNPRIPASAEVVGESVVQRHLNAFGFQCRAKGNPPNHSVLGKAVVFNQRESPIRFARQKLSDFPSRHLSTNREVSIADLPNEGERIEPNHPVLTVFAYGETQLDVETKLDALIEEIIKRLSS
jgi:predicted ATP-grasp superfamily ATP-dependent carboligase